MLLISFLLMAENGRAELFPNLGGQRVGTSSGQFLKIGIGARSLGMGESFVAVANDPEALYWNPAGIAQFDEHAFYFSHIQWFANINIEYVGMVYHLNRTNSLGLFFSSLATNDITETTELQPFGTGRTFIYSDMVGGMTYARNMTDRFSFGVTLKYFQETLAELTMSSVLFDLGTYYKTGWKTTRFAVSVTNFGPEISPTGSFTYKNLDNEIVKVKKFQGFTPPIMFRIGIASELVTKPGHILTSSIQLNHPNDNTENLNLGLEYWYRNLIALRAGYITGREERDLSAGVGLNLPVGKNKYRMDYSISNFGLLGYVSQIAIQVMF